ncbi:MAG TPA: SCO family protein [Gaiellaceae bacterium]|nr:SCO family protein [Gaiellaceae bacterium]
MRTRLLGPLLGLVVLAVAAAGCGGSSDATDGMQAAAQMPSPTKGFLLKPPSAAPPFSLRDQAGKTVGPQDDRGRWLAVTFLYTHCPDVCPLIADNLRAVLSRKPAMRVIAVSVDPKGDTPAAVEKFVAKHRLPATFSYVAGTRAQLAPVWKKYNIAAQPGPNGVISHSSYTVLVDPQGRERVLYDAQITAAAVLHDLAKLSRS